jgi:hypothetical protein
MQSGDEISYDGEFPSLAEFTKINPDDYSDLQAGFNQLRVKRTSSPNNNSPAKQYEMANLLALPVEVSR